MFFAELVVADGLPESQPNNRRKMGDLGSGLDVQRSYLMLSFYIPSR
jgi:hypothetical protein